MLYNQVDIIVTDSPIILGLFYWQHEDKKLYKSFADLAFGLFRQQNQINIFVERVKAYNPKGRNQTLEQSIEIDEKIKKFLRKNKIPFMVVPGNETYIDYVVSQIRLAEKKSCQNP
jgi:2-hydroxy-3-keto-5-methylthiopentenyl-1-phosphate phosphatase